MTILLAGGGTAGHVNPLLAVADALRELAPAEELLVVGTAEGLEARLVPARGRELATIARVPFPRRPNLAALRFPVRFAGAVREIRRLMAERDVDVVAGFGGYASAPAYVAARGRAPIVLHEANAMPGLANRLGARWAARVGVAFPNTPLPRAELAGMPLRREIVELDRAARRDEALRAFGLAAERPVLLVTGGSLGAKRINDAIRGAGRELVAAGWQLLHVVGRLSPFEDPQIEGYRVLEYCDRMDLAFAAADVVIARAGASTACELMAVGLPTIFVPYPVGNGEQAVNVRSLVAAGAARVVPDSRVDADWARGPLLELLGDREALAEMARRARAAGVRDGAERVAAMILEARRDGASGKAGERLA